MAPKGSPRLDSEEKSQNTKIGSPVRTPKSGQPELTSKADADYTSVGVSDHDVFLLPGSDLQLLGILTVIAAVVRLFRIYQPSSVVFDEVQYAQSHQTLY